MPRRCRTVIGSVCWTRSATGVFRSICFINFFHADPERVSNSLRSTFVNRYGIGFPDKKG